MTTPGAQHGTCCDYSHSPGLLNSTFQYGLKFASTMGIYIKLIVSQVSCHVPFYSQESQT